MKNRILRGRYRLKALVAKGGSGRVWLAEDLRLGQERAVKYLPGGEEEALREARLLAGLSHPAIPRLLEWIEEEDGTFLVMDYVKGESLEAFRAKREATERQAADWGIQLCRVLEYLHRQNPPVFYRDMKPSNVLLDGEGFLHLVDFGAAAPAREGGKSYGTPGYAAPEQYAGEAGPESDVYGLGRLLLELLPEEKGGPAPKALGRIPGLRALGRLPAVRRLRGGPGRKRGLRRILEKSTQEDRKKRYRTAAEFRAALESWQRGAKSSLRARAAAVLGALVLLAAGWGISGEARELAYQEALRLGRGAVEGGRPEEVIHQFYGRAVYWAPGRAEPYLELLDYYVQRGEAALGRYYVGEYRKAYPGALRGEEEKRVEEAVDLSSFVSGESRI